MAWQIFSSLAAGNQPLSLFDTLASQIAGTVVIPCTASGTNAISLVINPPAPAAVAPTVPSYTNYSLFSFVAANNSTGNVTLQVQSLGFLNLYTPGGTVQVASGGISAGVLYIVAYQQQLNASAGGFVIVSSTPASLTLPVSVANGGTSVSSFATTYGVICAGTTTTGPLQVIAGVGTSGQVLTSNGAAALPTFQPATSGAGSLVSIVTYTSTQTITIPALATKAFIRLVGGGAGAAANGAGSGGGYLEKYLTSLTSGNTLALTVGAGGISGNHNGGASTLASGTQTITTLTANGGTSTAVSTTVSGGTATNGDVNVTGDDAWGAFQITISCAVTNTSFAIGGGNPLSSIAINEAGHLFGGGGSNSNAGANGGCVIFWFT